MKIRFYLSLLGPSLLALLCWVSLVSSPPAWHSFCSALLLGFIWFGFSPLAWEGSVLIPWRSSPPVTSFSPPEAWLLSLSLSRFSSAPFGFSHSVCWGSAQPCLASIIKSFLVPLSLAWLSILYQLLSPHLHLFASLHLPRLYLAHPSLSILG